MIATELTSVRSARVQAVRRLTKRTFRARERRFLAEGPQAVREALASPGGVLELFATRDAGNRHGDLLSAAGSAGVGVQLVSGDVMAAMCQTVTPQGVVAVCGFVDVALDEVLAARPRLVAVLADDVLRVPIHGRAESLNLATAAAVCLYASARAQRRA